MSQPAPLTGRLAEPVTLRIFRSFLSFPAVLICLLAVLALLTVRNRFDDSDLWWHLKMGEVIWTTHAIPLADLFSFTTHHQSLVPQEWLAEVTIYAAYRCAGLSGLMFWLCFFAIGQVIAGYVLCALFSGNLKVAFAGAMLVWLFATEGFSLRPQLIAYLLLIVELCIIHLGRTRNARWFFILPAIFVIWINCHGSFMLGLILAGIYTFAAFFSFRVGSLVSEAWPQNSRRAFLIALGISVAALLLNPAGIRQILYPFDTMLKMPLLVVNVQEWAPLNMTEARGVALLAVLLLILLLAVTRRAELYFDELLLLTAGTWLAVSHQRMLPVFGILAAPIVSRQLAGAWENYEAAKDRIAPNAGMILLCLMALWIGFPSAANLQAQVEAQSPVKAVDFLRSSHLAGPMLNAYDFGGYLIWAAPEYPVFIDGRTDIYEWSGVLGEFGNWAMLRSDPRALLRKYKIGFCLLERQSPVAHVLALMPGWKLVYSDSISVIFARA